MNIQMSRPPEMVFGRNFYQIRDENLGKNRPPPQKKKNK